MHNAASAMVQTSAVKRRKGPKAEVQQGQQQEPDMEEEPREDDGRLSDVEEAPAEDDYHSDDSRERRSQERPSSPTDVRTSLPSSSSHPPTPPRYLPSLPLNSQRGHTAC